MMLHKESTTIPFILFFLKKKWGVVSWTSFVKISSLPLKVSFTNKKLNTPNWISILEKYGTKDAYKFSLYTHQCHLIFIQKRLWSKSTSQVIKKWVKTSRWFVLNRTGETCGIFNSYHKNYYFIFINYAIERMSNILWIVLIVKNSWLS